MKGLNFLLALTLLLLPFSGICPAAVDPGFGDSIDRSAEDFVVASLCVAEPTNWRDDALGVYGHAFIRLQCKTFDMDYCFSYESEDINGQLWRYLTGKLKMGMFAIPTSDYIQTYRDWNRAVHEYSLNLPPDVEQRLWRIMDNHVAEGTDLALNLDERGCASSAADYVVEALKPLRIQYKSVPDKNDLRIPARLAGVWKDATLDGRPLISYKGDLVEAPSATWWDIWFDRTTFIIILAVIALAMAVIVYFRKRK